MMFSPMDIMFIEEKEKELYELPHYVTERIDKEQQEVLDFIRKGING